MRCSSLFCCVTILSLILIHSLCVLSRCMGIGNLSLGIHPEGLIKVPYGKPQEIFCDDERYMADDLEFAIKGRYIPSEKVNATTIRLSIKQHKKGVFAYYCRNKVTKKYCPTRVLVDSAPEDVTDFTCKSKNLENLNCTWTHLGQYSVTNYYLTLLKATAKPSGVCIPEKRGRTRYCSWNTSSEPRYRQEEKQFFFNLKFSNIIGSNEQNFTIDHFSIIKPDPPSHLKVVGNGSHSVLLQWSIPNNMFDFLPIGVDHKIEYQIAKIDNTSYFRAVDTSGLPVKNKTYKFLLSNLPYAHMQYEVRIYIKTREAVNDEFWSDFTYLVFYTASEKPKRPPDTVVGAFDQNPFEAKRRIYVYWKQLEEYEEAGANFTYKVVAHQETGNPKTLLADNKKSLSYVVLEDASLEAVNVEIWSTNDNGSSLNKSLLYIPPYTDTVALRVPSFTKLAYENGTYGLSWVGVNDIDNYTVFWCQYNTMKICTSRMNFTVLEPNKTHHVIDLPRGNKHQFAISANNGTKTSGMVWASCDISKDGITMYGFPVTLDHGAPGKSFVKITWTMACTLQEGIITGYHITYCPVKDTSNVCDVSVGKTTNIISDIKKKEINITDLKPYTTYQFSFVLNTVFGLKTTNNTNTGVTTLEDTPTSPRNVSISEIRSNFIVISWDPPLDKNGIIGKYIIYNYLDEYAFDKVSEKDNDSMRRTFMLEGLDGFSNYSWSVAACNSAIRSCSQKSPQNGIFLRTRIGPPSKLSPTISRSADFIKWNSPEKPGGVIDMYQVITGGQVFNTTKLSFSLIPCNESAAEEKYQVRAVNFDEDPYHGELFDRIKDIPRVKHSRIQYPGEWSDPITVRCKSKHDFTTTFIIVAVIGTGICLFVIGYELSKRYKRRKT